MNIPSPLINSWASSPYTCSVWISRLIEAILSFSWAVSPINHILGLDQISSPTKFEQIPYYKVAPDIRNPDSPIPILVRQFLPIWSHPSTGIYIVHSDYFPHPAKFFEFIAQKDTFLRPFSPF